MKIRQLCSAICSLVERPVVLDCRTMSIRIRKMGYAGTALLIWSFLCTGCNVSSSDNVKAGPTKWKFVGAIHLGIENLGTEVAEFERDTNLVPNPAVIRVTTAKGSFSPDSLEQFRGLVHIDDAQAALRFVRFLTSRKYCYNWNTESTSQEIVSFSQYKTPDFADTGGADDAGYVGHPVSGMYGLLSDKAYREGNFQPPVVKAISGGYQIVRWICNYSEPKGTVVQQWQETVKRDGAYKRIILKTMPPPKLPATQWIIMGLS